MASAYKVVPYLGSIIITLCILILLNPKDDETVFVSPFFFVASFLSISFVYRLVLYIVFGGNLFLGKKDVRQFVFGIIILVFTLYLWKKK